MYSDTGFKMFRISFMFSSIMTHLDAVSGGHQPEALGNDRRLLVAHRTVRKSGGDTSHLSGACFYHDLL